MEENSISIINRTNGQLTGDKAQALPIKFVTSLSWLKLILIGVVMTIIAISIFIYFATKQVVQIEVAGKSDQFQLLKVQ